MDGTIQYSVNTRKVSELGKQAGWLEDVAYVGVKVTAVYDTSAALFGDNTNSRN